MSDSKDFLDFNKGSDKPKELNLGRDAIKKETIPNPKQPEQREEINKTAPTPPIEKKNPTSNVEEEYIESYELGMKNLGNTVNEKSIEEDIPILSKHLEDTETLKNRDTTFVFLYGASQAGKTSFLISLLHHLRADRNGRFAPRNIEENKDFHIFLRKILSIFFDERVLPKPTHSDKIYELDFEYEPNSPKIPAKFTFLDMQGERLEKVHLKEGNPGRLPDNIDKYFEIAGIKMCFIIMIPCDAGRYYDHIDTNQYRTDVEAKLKDTGDKKETWTSIDSNCLDFLDYVRSKDASFDNSHILFLVSQWDKYKGRHKDDHFEFMKERLPFTFARLDNKGSTIGTYSVGEVRTKKKNDGTLVEFLETINYNSPKKVKDWLYNVVTGHAINESNEPWYLKLFK